MKINQDEIYVYQDPINDNDFLVGTDSVSSIKKTKSFKASQLREYLIAGLNPEIGGTLKFTEVVYNSTPATPSAVANALNPNLEVLPYHVVVFSVNGSKYILKLQNVTIGVLQSTISDSDFIKMSGYISLGSEGYNLLAGYNAATGNQEFLSVKSTGLQLSVSSGSLIIESKEGAKLSDDFNFYKGLNGTTKLHEYLGIESESILISENESGTNLKIEIPSTASVPSLYVNKSYIPSYNDWLKGKTGSIYKGSGTIAKPYTDTIEYTDEDSYVITPNTSIQNAKDAYIGTGTKLNPEKIGQKIIIQNANSTYTFPGDFQSAGIYVKIEGDVSCTASGYCLDLDDVTAFDSISAVATIDVDSSALLLHSGLGFNNSGNSVETTNYASGRTIYMPGLGIIVGDSNDTSKYIINSDPLNSGNNNDGNITFEIRSRLLSPLQGVYKVGGRSRIRIYNECISGNATNTVSTSLKAYHQTGGEVIIYREGILYFTGGTRDNAITFTPTGGFTPIFVCNQGSFSGSATNLFNKTNNNNVVLRCTNSDSSYILTISKVFESTNLWEVYFSGNILATGVIDKNKVDLTSGNTISVINTIGANITLSLIVKGSKAIAQASYPPDTLFSNRKTVNSGGFVIGQEYKIVTIGSTDFTAVGAATNTVGLWFTASGPGSGTGTAYLETLSVV